MIEGKPVYLNKYKQPIYFEKGIPKQIETELYNMIELSEGIKRKA